VSENKQIAGPILAFVGGLVILIYGAVEVYIGEVASSIGNLNGLPVLNIGGVIIGGTLGIVFGLVIMASSVAVPSYPDSNLGLGVLIILFSIFSLVSVGGGSGVGFLLGVLGGTCCIVFGPEEPVRSPPTPPTPSASPPAPKPPAPSPTADPLGRTQHACPRCGKISLIAFTVCPFCGHRF